MAEFTTLLDGLAVMIRLGIHPHEAEPQRVVVSVAMTVDYPEPLGEDAIDRVLDYDFVRENILTLAAERRFALQETLCETIATLCLGDPRVRRVTVRTMKTDVYPDAGIGCEIVRSAVRDLADGGARDPFAFTRPALEKIGFVGWAPLLDAGSVGDIPQVGGTYVVAYADDGRPAFESASSGGWFKGRDPSVSTAVLDDNWVADALVVYIGKADNLRRRLREFAAFGNGRPVGHWGGRLVWQLPNRRTLLVAWRPSGAIAPLAAEADLLKAFRELHGKPPFANAPHLRGR